MTGYGQNILKVYDKNSSEIGSISYSGQPLPPVNANWSVKIAENYILFAGYGTNLDGSIYTNVMLYDYANNQVIWAKNVPQRIEPDKLNICLRDDNKVMVVLGGINDNGDLNVYALDIFTGQQLWTKTLINQKGRIVTLTSSVYGGVSQDIIGIRFSTTANQVPLTIYRFDPKNGNVLAQSSLTVYTQEVKYALSDIDNDNVKELLISDFY
ncbi:MAG: PQQ-like beta-propeller repeat protein, partial [bacterium]|nr:PQQ-like beta-propeller repeat protein [bacterium]MDW8163411.1 PQQ-binding-like beta-propeller repeat protein [Candidatus Omnitrophota bacterium]